jgi:transcriptional repressor OPI1
MPARPDETVAWTQSKPGFFNSTQSLSQVPSYAPPSYAQSHDPALLQFPTVPSTELPPIQPALAHNDSDHHTLPSLSSVTGPQPQRFPPPQPTELSYNQPAPALVNHWPNLNPFTAYYAPGHVQAAESPAKMDVDVSSNSAVSAASPDRFHDGRASSVSLDDPDVRIAAEALGNLRAGIDETLLPHGYEISADSSCSRCSFFSSQ